MAVYCTPKSSFLRNLLSIATLVVIAISWLPHACAQDPVIDRIDSLNLRPGQKASATVHGKQLAGTMSLWTPVGTFRPKEGTDLTKDQPVPLEGDIREDAIPGIYPARLVTNHGCSEAAWVVVDDLPGISVTAEADSKAGQLVALPCCLGGQINPVVSKFFRVALTAGQSVNIEVFARRLGSDLDPVLRVTGPNGAEVAFRDDVPGAEGDTRLQFQAATDGEYRIEVRDVRYSGGARHFFHLRLGKFPSAVATLPHVAQSGQSVSIIGATGDVLGQTSAAAEGQFETLLLPVAIRTADSDGSAFTTQVLNDGVVQSETEPNNSQEQATPISAETTVLSGCLQDNGDVDWLRITVTEPTAFLATSRTRETGSPCDLMFAMHKSDGGKLAENDDAGPRDAELAVQLPAAGDYFLKVSDIAGRGGAGWNYGLELFVGRKDVRITAPTDRLNVPRGGSASLVLNVQRINYDGIIHVQPVNLPAALTMNPFTIGAKQSIVPVTITAADPAAASSDNDASFVSFLFAFNDGSMIRHSFPQVAPPAPKKNDNEPFRSARLRNDLFTAVAPAAQFSLTVDQPTITVTQGMSATVNLKSTRAADWTMPIEIALATPADQLPPGITVTAGSMAAGELAVTINAAADATVGPFTLFLQGKAKKDNVEPVHPVPPIVVEVKAK